MKRKREEVLVGGGSQELSNTDESIEASFDPRKNMGERNNWIQ